MGFVVEYGAEISHLYLWYQSNGGALKTRGQWGSDKSRSGKVYLQQLGSDGLIKRKALRPFAGACTLGTCSNHHGGGWRLQVRSQKTAMARATNKHSGCVAWDDLV